MNMNVLRKLLLLSFLPCAAMSISHAYADNIVVYGTGLNTSGGTLAIGQDDPHYSLTASPYGPSTALATTLAPRWVEPTTNDAWIGYGADNSSSERYDLGDYTYQTTFDLSGFSISSVILSGSYAGDDTTAVYLNGVEVGSSVFRDVLTPITLDSGFVSGVNTLDFVVNNVGGATGLLTELNGTGNLSPVPEPSTLALVGGGIISFGATLRRRHRR